MSVVGTLLLQIGEVGQKFDQKKSFNMEEEACKESDSDQVDGSVDEKDEHLLVEEKGHQSYDNNWIITFEQFLASILTEPALVDHFSEKIDLQVSIFFVIICASGL